MTMNFVQFVLFDDDATTRSTWSDDCWLQVRGVGLVKLVARRRLTEASADRRRREDADELLAERTRADTVQREVDAVVETVRHSGDVLGGQQAVDKTACGARRRGGVQVDVVEKHNEPADAVWHVEDDESRRDDEQQDSHVVVALTSASSLLPPVMLLLRLLMVVVMMIET